MTPQPHRRWTCAICVGVLVLTNACSSGKKSGGQSAPGTGPNPNRTESAPPGDIPDNQAFVGYAAPDKSFTVKVPEGWARTSAGSAVLFTDKYNSIRIESHHAATQPSVDSARATELPIVKGAEHGYLPGSVKSVRRTAGPAVLITYRADSAANPVTNKVAVEAVERYEFWHNGLEVVLTLSAPVGSDNVDPWRTITDSFGWTA